MATLADFGHNTSIVGTVLTIDFLQHQHGSDDVILRACNSDYDCLDDRVNITLFDNKNKLIGSKNISVSGNQENETGRFQITPNKIGENKFLVKCSALPDEINIQNNQQKITLQVMKDEYNIALITGAPNYNTRFIKDHLSNTKNNNIDHFVYVNNKFKPSLKEFWKNNYEVIIFDNNQLNSRHLQPLTKT